MNPLSLHLGGVIATTLIVTVEAAAAQESIDALDLLLALLWPVWIALLLIDVVRGWRP